MNKRKQWLFSTHCPWAGGRQPPELVPRPIIVCGSRTFTDKAFVYRTLDRLTFWTPLPRVITGDAKGVDAIAFKWAEDRWWPRSKHEANWYGHGLAAGPIRNRAMLKDAGPKAYLIAFWDGSSPGTKDMLSQARKVLKPNRIKVVKI